MAKTLKGGIAILASLVVTAVLLGVALQILGFKPLQQFANRIPFLSPSPVKKTTAVVSNIPKSSSTIANLTKQNAQLSQQVKNLRSELATANSQISSLQLSLSKQKTTTVSVTAKAKAEANLIATMQPSQAVPILQSMGVAEAALILSEMPTSTSSQILAGFKASTASQIIGLFAEDKANSMGTSTNSNATAP